jgi:hypothetical protein
MLQFLVVQMIMKAKVLIPLAMMMSQLNCKIYLNIKQGQGIALHDGRIYMDRDSRLICEEVVKDLKHSFPYSPYAGQKSVVMKQIFI